MKKKIEQRVNEIKQKETSIGQQIPRTTNPIKNPETIL